MYLYLILWLVGFVMLHTDVGREGGLFLLEVLSIVVMGLLLWLCILMCVVLLVSVDVVVDSMVGIDHFCVIAFVQEDVLGVVVVAVNSVVVVVGVLVVVSGVTF